MKVQLTTKELENLKTACSRPGIKLAKLAEMLGQTPTLPTDCHPNDANLLLNFFNANPEAVDAVIAWVSDLHYEQIKRNDTRAVIMAELAACDDPGCDKCVSNRSK